MSSLKTIGGAVLAAVVLASLLGHSASIAQDKPAAPRLVFLDQGWSDQDRLAYYNTSQGSAAISYDVFLALEMADGQAPFRSDDNMRRYGLVPQSANPDYNPDGLPIGIARTIVPEGRWKGEWVGLNCAACHNGQLEYRGTSMRVAGGNAGNFDIIAFIDGLADAVSATVADPQKFARMANRLGLTDAVRRDELHRRLEGDAIAVRDYRDGVALTPHPVGPGRVDALGLIHNQVQSSRMGIPENWRAALAPVKPSFVWNLPQSAWAQWSGTLKDPLLRNGGESLGVFVRMDLTSKTPAEGLFDSTIDLPGQMVSEDLLRRVAPPPWPEDILGPIDRDKVAKGEKLFGENCASCHSTWPHRWSEPKLEGKRFIENAIVPIAIVGTDATQFTSPQFDPRPTIRTGALAGSLEAPDTGAVLASPPAVFLAVTRGVFGRALDKLHLSPEALRSAHGYRSFFPDPQEPVPALLAYKAQTAEGMWSAPPFLHNGSVPNLYELLGPAAARSRTFFIGREFDPVRVGVDTSGNSGTFLYNTLLIGNANTGHSFEDGPRGNGVIGRKLSEEDRWDLVEYMKSIPSQPHQIVPFGGPANPFRAWTDTSFFNLQNPGTYNGAPVLN